jgi:hypothetical protein
LPGAGRRETGRCVMDIVSVLQNEKLQNNMNLFNTAELYTQTDKMVNWKLRVFIEIRNLKFVLKTTLTDC